jgi:hypothetical protein
MTTTAEQVKTVREFLEEVVHQVEYPGDGRKTTSDLLYEAGGVFDDLDALRTRMEQLELDLADAHRIYGHLLNSSANDLVNKVLDAEAKVEQLEQRLEAKDKLLVAYRLGDQHRADEALTALAALDREEAR